MIRTGSRCWVHKTANVLNKLPVGQQAKAKKGLHEIWMAECRADAEQAFDVFLSTYEAKYPKATECLAKDRHTLLTFYNFPRTLAAPADHEPDRIDLRNGALTDHQDPWLRLPRRLVGHGLQASKPRRPNKTGGHQKGTPCYPR